MHPMQVNRYLHELDQRGYIKLAGGNRKTGFEYKIQVWDDYEILKQGTALLDTLLTQLKAEEIKGGHPMTNRSLTEV